MSPEKDLSDWEKELEERLEDLKNVSSPVEMRKLEPDAAEKADADPEAAAMQAASEPDEESAAVAHGKSLTDTVYSSNIDEMDEITSGASGEAGAEAEGEGVHPAIEEAIAEAEGPAGKRAAFEQVPAPGEDLVPDEEAADAEELAAAVEEAPFPDERPEREEGSRTDFSMAVEGLFAKMVAEAKAAGEAPPGQGVADVGPALTEVQAETDDFIVAVSGMFQDLAQRAESLVRRVSTLEREREKLSRRAGEAEGTAEREVARSEALEERLRELEKLRAETLSRIRELEHELAQQVDVVMQEKVSRLEEKLVEAYDVIKVIEDAYLAGRGLA